MDCIHISEEQRCEIRALLARRDDLMQMLAERLARRNTDRCYRHLPVQPAGSAKITSRDRGSRGTRGGG